MCKKKVPEHHWNKHFFFFLTYLLLPKVVYRYRHMLCCASGLASRRTIKFSAQLREKRFIASIPDRCLSAHTHVQRGSIMNFELLPREFFISGDVIVLFYLYWCKAYVLCVCVCWRDMVGNRLLLVLIPVWLCCSDQDPRSGGVRPQAELLCVS